MTFGDVEVIRVPEWSGAFVPGLDFVPDSGEQDWKRNGDWLAPEHWEMDSGIALVAMQVWVLRSEGRTILVDTGMGNDKPRPVPVMDHRSGDFLDRLAKAGVRPEDVDVVVNTHVHADHVGWNTRLVDDEWVPTFPNATYLIPKADFEFFHPDAVARNSKMPEVHANLFEDSVAPVHQAGQATLFEGEVAIDGNLRLVPAPGHTPGSTVLRLESGEDRAVFVGDLLHSPIQMVEPEYNSCFCEDAEMARISRRRVLGWAADNTALVVPAHLRGAGGAVVARSGAKFSITAWAPFENVQRED
jgi:glyoxylase-like metal-dependent hydrolase (beta-lactamase superfamily II)